MAVTYSGLHPELAKIAKNLPWVARIMGFEARVTSGFRTHAKQKKLYDAYRQGLSPLPAAVPGTSDHEIGYAIDVTSTNQDKLVALLTSAGLYWAGPSDPVHFSLLGRSARKFGDIVYVGGESKKYEFLPPEQQAALFRTGKWGPLGSGGPVPALIRGVLKGLGL